MPDANVEVLRMASDRVEDISPVAAACPSYSSILEEHNVGAKQRQSRIDLLKKIAKLEGERMGGKCAVLSLVAKEGALGAGLESSDIAVLGNLLGSIGDADVLCLIIHSPGGDGTCVEKFVALCRAQCSKFHVAIPYRAKSAATLIALGADDIIMGHSSELGPIDAQVAAVAGGITRYLSAQSFIDARSSLLQQYAQAKAKNEDVQPILQMLATLDLPFIEECQRMMDFGRDVAKKLLLGHMFKKRREADKMVANVVEKLSSVKMHKVHGRMIDGGTARVELGLKVSRLAKDDALWQAIWEYYTRADIALSSMRSPKMFETIHEVLAARMAQ